MISCPNFFFHEGACFLNTYFRIRRIHKSASKFCCILKSSDISPMISETQKQKTLILSAVWVVL